MAISKKSWHFRLANSVTNRADWQPTRAEYWGRVAGGATVMMTALIMVLVGLALIGMVAWWANNMGNTPHAYAFAALGAGAIFAGLSASGLVDRAVTWVGKRLKADRRVNFVD